MGIAGLGALAGGLSRGIQIGDDLATAGQLRKLRQEDQDFQQEQRGWMRADRQRADKQRTTLEQIDAEFLKNIAPQPQGLAAVAPLEIGSPAEAGAQPESLGAVAKPRPSEDTLYHAMRKRTDALARAGLMDQWRVSFQDTERVGQMARQKNIAPALAKLQAGDPSGLAAIYGYVNDGKKITKAELVGKGENGPVFAITQRDEDTGEERTAQVDYAAVLQMAETAMNPQAAISSALNRYHEMFKASLDVKKNDEKEEARERREMRVADHKDKLEHSQIEARGREDRKTRATPTAGDSSFTLSEGQVRYTRGKDGKPVEVARGDPKTTRGGNTAETKKLGQMLQSVKEQRLDVQERKKVVTEEYKADIKDASKKEKAEAKSRYDAKMKELNDEDQGYRKKYDEIDRQLGFAESGESAKAPTLKFDKNGNLVP